MKKILLSLALGVCAFTVNAQIAYDFAASSGTYTAISGGISPVFVSSDPVVNQYTETDEGYANGNPIGFTFNYNGSPYTTFNICSNGFISLGVAMTEGDVYWRNLLATGPVNGTANNKVATRPLIAPLWDDLDFAATSDMTYLTSGSAGNKVLTVQWTNAKWNYNAAAGSVSFQVKLYEVDGRIEFIYKAEAGSITSGSASVGITATATGTDNFISVSAFSTSATTSKSTETTSISTKPATGLTFTFTPGALPAQDVSVLGYASLPFTGCHNTPQTVVVRLKNSGSAIILAGAASLNLKSSGANTVNVNGFNASDIAVGATQDVTFSNLNFNTSGANALVASVTLASDPNQANDTSKTTINTATTVTSFPASEGAEVIPLVTFPWLRAFAGSNAWYIESNGYRNGDMTPNTADSLYPKAGTNYYVFDSYNAPSGTKVLLYSNCFTLPAITSGFQYDISFWMSHDSSFAANADSIYVNVSTNRGSTWTRLAGFQRRDATFTIPGWKKENVSLVPYAGQTIMLGFEGVGKFGNIMGIDEITVRGNAGLPISLVNFSGVKEGENNILKWETTNEISNTGFELLRSVDGKNFSKITFVATQAKDGSSNTNLQYSYVDAKALAGNNYYQLKQIDKDGKSTLSNVVFIKGKTPKQLEITSVYPNPAITLLNVLVAADKNETVTMSITDLAGKVISNQSVQLNQGSNNIQLNTSKLLSGSYLVKLVASDNKSVQIQKFVKQ